jgi:hypothetical protein
MQGILHVFSPGHARGIGSESSFGSIKVPINRSLEGGVYVGAEYEVNSLLSFKAGLRNSSFANYGDKTTYTYDNEGSKIDSSMNNGGIYQTYMKLGNPDFGVNVTLNEKTSVKASYSRTAQYIQMARNSSAGTPLDIWFAASPNVKPQIGDQIAGGIFRNFFKDRIKASAEVYYKWMQNTIDFKDDAILLLNEDLEAELRYGKSWAYGAEFMVRYQFDKISGWASYTYSHTERKIEGINDNNSFLAPYDKPHDVSIVFNYDVLERLSIGATWVYSSGLPGTFPQTMAEILNNYVPVYSGRNEQRYPAYHRMDFSLTWKNKPWGKGERKVLSDWNLSVYNLYNRHNAWSINFEQDAVNPNQINTMKTYLFGIFPTVTYNIKF